MDPPDRKDYRDLVEIQACKDRKEILERQDRRDRKVSKV